ncbi:hypothetical protein CCHL11_02846 [Colletotrichum chlorophyti]|uniref:Uncharacterized protein n=1 Tax=Colletotrichum chlorophyti TaxID=708187 RepID=A0A1Q8S0R4_9PEZI|nr:hypothetical protein CCHL11_02846 [Colletotrichum chlorophyti]
MYAFQCQVFNAALRAVSVPAKKSPYANSVHNWKATTTLLSLSSNLDRPLVIEQESYRAIRRVLLALPKSDSERDTASTLISSWPPYRILRDGMEEKAGTEEYLSRVTKAGIMMQEAGYSKKEIDLVVDILGGMAPDGSPTIQTRSVYPRRASDDHATWAALIRTTRNAQEAWAIFKHPPDPGVKPTLEVYWQLILKLGAKPPKPNHNNLPGDGREVFPFDDMNLSEFEKARVTPPSIRTVTDEMFKAGFVLGIRELAWLIRNAPTVSLALHYIDHSSLDDKLKREFRRCMEKREVPSAALTEAPRDILHACIDLLCRLQPNRTANTSALFRDRSFQNIHNAMRLAKMGWASADASGRAWESILFALARPNIMVSNNQPQYNNVEVLLLVLEVLETAEGRCGLSLSMMDFFATVIRKATFPRLTILLNNWASNSTSRPEDQQFLSLYRRPVLERFTPTRPAFKSHDTPKPSQPSWRKLLTPIFQSQQSGKLQTACEIVQEASEQLKACWRVLATDGPASDPNVNGLVKASQINTYMRTLAFVGDREEMVRVLWWVIREWAPKAGSGLSLADAERLERAVRAFRAFAEPMLDEDVVAPLREEIIEQSYGESKCVVYWPGDEEIEEYINSDEWGNLQNLRAVLTMAKDAKEHEECEK